MLKLTVKYLAQSYPTYGRGQVGSSELQCWFSPEVWSLLSSCAVSLATAPATVVGEEKEEGLGAW